VYQFDQLSRGRRSTDEWLSFNEDP
jgi:hypothetical protein